MRLRTVVDFGGLVSLRTRKERIWGAVVIVASVTVVAAGLLASWQLGLVSLVLGVVAGWQLFLMDAAARRDEREERRDSRAALDQGAARGVVLADAQRETSVLDATMGGVDTMPAPVMGGPGYVAPTATAPGGALETLGSDSAGAEPPVGSGARDAESPGASASEIPAHNGRAPMPAVFPKMPATLDPTQVLQALMEAARPVCEPIAAHLWLEDEPTATLRLIASAGPMPPSSQPVALEDDDVLSAAVQHASAEFRPQAQIRGRDGTSMLWRFALPLDTGTTRGVAALDFQSATPPDASRLPDYTAPLRGSLTGCLALHIARSERDTAQALIEVARELSRILDPQEVLSTSLARAMSLASAQTGSVMLVDPDSGRLVMVLARGLPTDAVRDVSLAEGEGIAGWVFASNQPLLVEDLPARTPAARRHGVRSAVSVPISDGDGVLGVLNVGSRSFPARFSESHLSAIEMLGRQTATALRNARAVAESRELYFDTLKALAIALETKDPYSAGGTERVLEYADALGQVFELIDEERDALRIAALLHDIGMAAAGEGVVAANRPLSTVERALLKMHPQIAAEILAEAPALRHVVPIVYHHHEWFDGEGYVGGLSGRNIPIGARILAVADAYVAMTSDRPYRPAMSQRDAIRELKDKAGTQFDPAVIEAFIDMLRSESDRVPGSSN